MSILDIINNKKFLTINQFERRDLIGKHKLNIRKCSVGNEVICFENETVSTNYGFYTRIQNHSLICLTIGKSYTILGIDIENENIKIKNDNNHMCWYTNIRFVRSLSYERKLKLKKINKDENII